MAKKNLKKYKGGGINWKELGYGITNTGKAVADVGLSALGADDAISDQDYKGNSGTAFSKVSGTAGSVTKALVPTALAIGGGALAASMGQNPMMGAQIGMGVGKGIQGIGGAANPQNDPRGERSEIQGNMATNERLESSIYGLGDTSMALGKSIAPMIAQAESAGSARYGGVMKKCEDGGEVSKDHSSYYINDNSMSNEQRTIWGGVKYRDKGFLGGSGLPVAPTAMFPYGGTFQVNGPSHEEGGVEINSPNGNYEVEKQEVIKTEPGQDKILSDKLIDRSTGKTYAKSFSPYQKLKDMLQDPKKSISIPDSIKNTILPKIDNVFNQKFDKQESEKITRVKNSIEKDFVKLSGLVTHKNGGIHIKKENEGLFTNAAKRAGMGVQEYAQLILDNKENYTNTLIKRANFANNASKWEHSEGGYVNNQYPNGGTKRDNTYVKPANPKLTQKELDFLAKNQDRLNELRKKVIDPNTVVAASYNSGYPGDSIYLYPGKTGNFGMPYRRQVLGANLIGVDSPTSQQELVQSALYNPDSFNFRTDSTEHKNIFGYRKGGLVQYGNGGPNKKIIDRNAYASDFTRFEKQGAGNNDIAGDMVDSNFQNLGFKKATDVSDQYPVWISPEGQYVIKHPSGKGYVAAGNAQSLRLQNFNVGNNTQSRTTTSNVTNTPNNVTLTKQIDPNRLPYKFGSDYNFDPNTGKYFTGAAPLEDNSNIVNTQSFNFKNGGIKKFRRGGREDDFTRGTLSDVRGRSEEDSFIIDTKDSNLNNTSNITYKEHDIPKGTDWGKVGSELAMGVTQNMGNIYDINRGRNAETEKFDRLSFSKLDPTEALRQNMRSYVAAKKQIKEGSVGNASSYMTNVNQAYINRMNMDNKTRSDYNNANVGITNNERVANQSIDTQEKIANAQNRAMARNLTSSGLGNMGQNIAGQVADSKRTAADEKTLKMYMSYYNDPQFRKAMKDAGYVI